MEKLRLSIKDFNGTVEIGQVVNLESENFGNFLVKEINSKSVILQRLMSIRDDSVLSSTEQKFKDLWIEMYPQIDLIYQFPLPDRYRIDFFHLQSKTAIETHGGIWQKGGHNTGIGITRNCKKICMCTSLGYRFFAISTGMIDEKWLSLIGQTILGIKNEKRS